jgi:L-erythro-3,5-diaminohexanoate dehydrogenase
MGRGLEEFGCHRVIGGKGFPQSAERVNSASEVLSEEEALVEVEEVLLDSTSMRQLSEGSGGDHVVMGSMIEEILRKRGKMHNPVTQSGGVLLGKVVQVGSLFSCKHQEVRVGSVVVPVSSLSAIPLRCEGVEEIRGERVVLKKGIAVVFSSMKFCVVDARSWSSSIESIDNSEFAKRKQVALSSIDISSLVPQVRRVLKRRMQEQESKKIRMMVVGLGKAGLAALHVVDMMRRMNEFGGGGGEVEVIGVDYSVKSVEYVRGLGLMGVRVEQCDGRDGEWMYLNVLGGKGCDVVVNVVNIGGSETSSVLCCREGGTVVWFSMATQFDRAALATDALGRDVEMIIGNGVANGQIEETLALMEAYPKLKEYFLSH